jgi:glycosyltransferase involved in cell wall biosynthesis
MTKISICIPAYKRPENIARLLDSIAMQTFKDFEVVITDDSPDDSVKNIISNYSQLPLRYYKNSPALGTPANWNYGISLANGEWIKMMHDDDWFSNDDSLQKFDSKTKENIPFIFSRYENIFETGHQESPAFPESWKQRIIQNPMTLISTNVIGPPSVTLIHHSIKETYDPDMKWRVDIDYYIRLLNKYKVYALINEPLINVGIGSSQVTNSCINQPEVELSEGLSLLKKNGVAPLRNLMVYDAWWRILRNTNTRRKEQLYSVGKTSEWPEVIIKMVEQQSKIPGSLLIKGVVSKSAMFASYILNRKHLRN